MTTSPTDDDRTAPPGSPPPAGPVPAPLTEVLAELVRDGTLSDDQARAVVGAWSARAVTATRRSDVSAPLPEAPGGPPPAAPPWRTRLLEATVYLGAAFVLAAVGIVIGQAWGGLSRNLQVLLVSGLAALGLVAGLVVGGPVRPTPGGPLDPAHAVRRRSASVILTATAALVSAAVAVVLGDHPGTGVAASAAALAVMILCQFVAPSVISELALFGAAALLVGSTSTAAVPEPGPDAEPAEWEARSRLTAGLLLGFGGVWAWVLSPRLRYRLVGVTVGLGLAIIGALAMQAGARTAPTVVALALLAAAALLTYLRDPEWPWITAAVIAATIAVFVVAGDTVGIAVAFLVAGLVLLAGVAVAVVLNRRRSRRRADVSRALRPPVA